MQRYHENFQNARDLELLLREILDLDLPPVYESSPAVQETVDLEELQRQVVGPNLSPVYISSHVAGSSQSTKKACAGCRKAHHACDEPRPCHRCRRLKMICEEALSKKRGRPLGSKNKKKEQHVACLTSSSNQLKYVLFGQSSIGSMILKYL